MIIYSILNTLRQLGNVKKYLLFKKRIFAINNNREMVAEAIIC